jgi:predicted PurR-regulated permease PerM
LYATAAWRHSAKDLTHSASQLTPAVPGERVIVCAGTPNCLKVINVKPASREIRPDPRAGVVLWIAVALVIYLCWRLIAPFLPAIAFAFALAMLGNPLYRWLLKRLGGKNAAAVISVVVICLTLVVPVIFLVQVLVREAIQGITAVSDQKDLGDIRNALEHSGLLGSLLRWLDSRLDWPKEAAQIARGAMQWFSTLTSSIISGSAWAITQIAAMIVVLFYFLRDQENILAILRSLVPLSEKETGRLFARITETIRISLYGKVLVAFIQGGLGGLIFWWLGLPAPAFWGLVMALLSVLPVLGAFVIWVPVAVALALQGHWGRALLLTGWGILIVHPIDNFLGPVLVGTKLRLHTLLIFFSVIGGLAAFGAPGIVLGPVTVAIAVSLFDIWQRRREDELADNL